MKKSNRLSEPCVRGVQMESDTSGCPVQCLPDLIRKRAFELFEARGRRPGGQLADWLQAEYEIKHHLGLENIPEPKNFSSDANSSELP